MEAAAAAVTGADLLGGPSSSGGGDDNNSAAGGLPAAMPLARAKATVRLLGRAARPVRDAFRRAGLRPAAASRASARASDSSGGGNGGSGGTAAAGAWSVLWGRPADALADAALLAALGPFQRVCHFPGTWELGRKDLLHRNLAAAARWLKARPGSGSSGNAGGAGAFDGVAPATFLLPGDADALRADAAAAAPRKGGGGGDGPYIVKPVASSRGRGVRVVPNAAAALTLAAERGAAKAAGGGASSSSTTTTATAGKTKAGSASGYLVQRYIADPYLIEGHKFDLRVYVAVTCLEPLRVYVHREGLVRFAAEAYRCCGGGSGSSGGGTGGGVSASALRQRRRQLTNYSINKKQKASSKPPEAGAGAPLKWSFGQLRAHLEAAGRDWGAIWAQVEALAAKALIAAAPRMAAAARAAVRRRGACFEVRGPVG